MPGGGPDDFVVTRARGGGAWTRKEGQNPEEGYIGEDYLFCDRARELGFEVWIDPSIPLGHMGVQEYMGDYGRDVLYPMIAPSVKEVA